MWKGEGARPADELRGAPNLRMSGNGRLLSCGADEFSACDDWAGVTAGVRLRPCRTDANGQLGTNRS